MFLKIVDFVDCMGFVAIGYGLGTGSLAWTLSGGITAVATGIIKRRTS